MPKLWSETLGTHRRAVQDAILETAANLAFEHGVTSITMSQIAEAAGIGRATLYKYFSDVESILVAWHERQVSSHLEQLAEVRDRAGKRAPDRLGAVLHAYATNAHRHHGTELAAFLHRGKHLSEAHQQLKELVQALIAEGSSKGEFRNDVPAGELASYCLHALSAAGEVSSTAAVRRLVLVTLGGLR